MYLNELGVHKDSNETQLYLNLQEEFHNFLQNRSIRVITSIVVVIIVIIVYYTGFTLS